MPISICQESVQDVFSHTVQVVIRQRHSSVSQGLFVKHLVFHFNNFLSPEEVSFAGQKRELPLKLLILPCLPLHIPIPCATAACSSIEHRACSVVWRLRHRSVRRQTAWQHPTARLDVILTTQKQEKSALSRLSSTSLAV